MSYNEKIIGGKTVMVQPWPFTQLMRLKPKFFKLVKEPLKELFGDEEGNIDVVKVITEVVESFDDTQLDWFMDTILSGVTVDNISMANLDERDFILAGQSGLFYSIAGFVLEVNYGDFLDLLKTNMGFDLRTLLTLK